MAQGVRDAARNIAFGAATEKRPYLKMAFANPYNLSLFGGGILASILTLNPVLLIATLGMEAIWLLNAPENRRLRMLLWDPRFESLRKAIQAEDRKRRLTHVSERDRERVDGLVARKEQIEALAEQNPSFTGELLKNELVKTDRLVDAFIEMALTCARYTQYLETVDEGSLDRDRNRYMNQMRGATEGDPQFAIAKKNLEVVAKRLERLGEIRRYLQVARGQLDLIENSFQLIADQIVTMQSPQELSGQLDELLDGVEAIKASAKDTESFLKSIEREL